MSAPTEHLASIRNKRIFIVEDNLENRVVFQMLFIKHGSVPTFERWGRETISRLKGMAKIDLILLDLMLPHGNSGFDIFNQIRALPQFESVPIVAVSAMEPSIAIPKAQELGFSGFIAKPIDTLIFADQIASILQGEKIWYVGNGIYLP